MQTEKKFLRIYGVCGVIWAIIFVTCLSSCGLLKSRSRMGLRQLTDENFTAGGFWRQADSQFGITELYICGEEAHGLYWGPPSKVIHLEDKPERSLYYFIIRLDELEQSGAMVLEPRSGRVINITDDSSATVKVWAGHPIVPGMYGIAYRTLVRVFKTSEEEIVIESRADITLVSVVKTSEEEIVIESRWGSSIPLNGEVRFGLPAEPTYKWLCATKQNARVPPYKGANGRYAQVIRMSHFVTSVDDLMEIAEFLRDRDAAVRRVAFREICLKTFCNFGRDAKDMISGNLPSCDEVKNWLEHYRGSTIENLQRQRILGIGTNLAGEDIKGKLLSRLSDTIKSGNNFLLWCASVEKWLELKGISRRFIYQQFFPPIYREYFLQQLHAGYHPGE